MEVGESESHAGRGFRQRKSKANPMCCPICGVTLRANEMDHHFAVEVDRLERILKPKKHISYRSADDDAASIAGPSYSNGEGPSHSGNSSSASTANGHEELTRVAPEECWGTYQKIKNNRQARLKVKSRKRKPEDNVCPICNKATLEDITRHVEACLRKSESTSAGYTATNGSGDDEDDDDDASIDVEGESFDTYEWAGQKRTRVTALLGPGELAGIGMRLSNGEDTDDELNVDGDDSQVYGTPQYSVKDVIVSDDSKASATLRELVIANEPPTVKRAADDNPGEGTSKVQQTRRPSLDQTMDTVVTGEAADVIESLKAKILEYEKYIRNRPKCLICMDDFRKPVVSVCCWHVYCEECWLHTLGAKKLCPQCSMITSPIDLRRIYL